MTITTAISVLPFESASKEFDLLSLFATSMDVPLNNSQNPIETFEYFYRKNLSLILLVEGNPAGVVSLSQNLKHSTSWLTSTLIFNGYRGSGLNQQTKKTLVQTGLRIDLPLGCIVRDWNARSLGALQKAFPELTYKPLELKHLDYEDSSNGWYVDFSQVQPCILEDEVIDLSLAVTSWWHEQKALVAEKKILDTI